MSKQENNKQLRDLLRQQGQEPLQDPFEREALEGFASLENEQEAFAMKDELDKRIQNEVLAPARSKKVFYWTAAAGLILFIGFAVYLFRDVPVTSQPLVINRAQEQKEPQIGPPPAENEPAENTEKDVQPFTQEKKKTEKNAELKTGVQNELKDEESAASPEEKKPVLSVADAAVAAPSEENPAGGAEGGKQESSESAMNESAEPEIQKEKKSSRKESRQPAAPTVASNAHSTIVYEANHNDADFNLRLNQYLNSREIRKSFDADLVIEKGNKIRLLNFSDSASMQKSEIRDIRDAIKEYLRSAFTENKAATTETYNVKYRP